MTSLPMLDASSVSTLPIAAAADALVAELTGGLEPAADPARSILGVPGGHLLLMPSIGAAFTGVKLATLAPGNPAVGRPRVQGVYVLFDAPTLRPLAILDGVALTTLRTAAVSAVAARLLAPLEPHRLVVFGTGPQAEGHIAALTAVLPVGEVIVVGRTPGRAEELAGRTRTGGVSTRAGTAAEVAAADLVVCATTSTTPLFDGTAVRDDALVIAVGSHEPGVTELDTTLMARSQVVVEDVATALREAGEVVAAVATGVLTVQSLIGLADLVCGRAAVDRTRPRVFKCVGMAWEDRVVAAQIFRQARPGATDARADQR